MLFLRFDRGLYAYVFIGVVLFVHGYAIYDDPSAVPILALLIALGSFAFCMKMCQDEEYGYLAGLENVARRHAGPLIQITALILVPIFYASPPDLHRDQPDRNLPGPGIHA